MLPWYFIKINDDILYVIQVYSYVQKYNLLCILSIALTKQ